MEKTNIISLNNIGFYSNGTLNITYQSRSEKKCGSVGVRFTIGDQSVTVDLKADFTVEDKVTQELADTIGDWLGSQFHDRLNPSQSFGIVTMVKSSLETACV